MVGTGVRAQPGVAATFFTALAHAGANIKLISTFEIRISIVVEDVNAIVR